MISSLRKLASTIQKSENLKGIATCEIIAEVPFKSGTLPIYAYTLGASALSQTTAPLLFITGGFHGLERIGAQLAWSLLKTTLERITWDRSLRAIFESIRLIVVPLVNPVGYSMNSRANGNGVDLMRNSPVVASEKVPFLIGGHRISSLLPWYQGEVGRFEKESRAVVDLFMREAQNSTCVIALDFHSGFGMKDRLWFPFSCKAEPFDNLAEMMALTELFEQTHPYHIYQIEPQSKGYLFNGDIWDHLYLQYKAMNSAGVFLPLTLEMGSWTWVRKNPAQIFSRLGVFNPIKKHRLHRTYRRHHLLFDFMLKAVNSNEVWAGRDERSRVQYERSGLARWY